MIPYGRQTLDDDDVAAVVAALRSPWLTTGPRVDAFEGAVCEAVGARHGVAVSSGTSALHAAHAALGLGPGDEVIVPTLTFVATANAALYVGATPRFADVDPSTLLVDPASVEALVGPRTRAIVGVDYAGQPCDWAALRRIADRHGLRLVADACHALGASDRGQPVGTLADATVLSFHPVKHITTCEGGMVLTDDDAVAARARRFRNHGVSSDHRQRAEHGTHRYEMVELGHNLRLSDVACALGASQLAKLPAFVARRRAIAARYDAAFGPGSPVVPLVTRPDVVHAYHLYVVRLRDAAPRVARDDLFTALRERGVGANVHYLPVHLHRYYREALGTHAGLCPNAEAAYDRIVSLPMYPAMSDADVEHVVASVRDACASLTRATG